MIQSSLKKTNWSGDDLFDNVIRCVDCYSCEVLYGAKKAL